MMPTLPIHASRTGIYGMWIPSLRALYIGHSARIRERAQGHIRELLRRQHPCAALQTGFDQVGTQALSIVVLEDVTGSYRARERREALWLYAATRSSFTLFNGLAPCTKEASFVNHLVTGRRPIPIEDIEVILETLNLSYDVTLSEGRK